MKFLLVSRRRLRRVHQWGHYSAVTCLQMTLRPSVSLFNTDTYGGSLKNMSAEAVNIRLFERDGSASLARTCKRCLRIFLLIGRSNTLNASVFNVWFRSKEGLVCILMIYVSHFYSPSLEPDVWVFLSECLPVLSAVILGWGWGWMLAQSLHLPFIGSIFRADLECSLMGLGGLWFMGERMPT